MMGSGSSQVVSMLAFYSVDPSSNPAEVYSFNSVNCLKRTKIIKERPGLVHFLKWYLDSKIFLVRASLDAFQTSLYKQDFLI